MITLQNISKSFGSNTVLHKISATLAEGQVHGVVGLNGAGKTTLFRCIAGMLTYSGDIHSQYVPLKNHIGFLEAHPVIMDRITGWEYCKLHALARGQDRKDFHAVNIFNLPLDDYAAHYSTGMKKKLALMATLLQNNDIYILDEPFSGVDITSNIIIQDIIRSLVRNGKTVLLASHIFSAIKDLCDEVYLLRDGILTKPSSSDPFLEIERALREQQSTSSIDTLISAPMKPDPGE